MSESNQKTILDVTGLFVLFCFCVLVKYWTLCSRRVKKYVRIEHQDDHPEFADQGDSFAAVPESNQCLKRRASKNTASTAV